MISSRYFFHQDTLSLCGFLQLHLYLGKFKLWTVNHLPQPTKATAATTFLPRHLQPFPYHSHTLSAATKYVGCS